MISLRGLTDHTVKSYSTYIRSYLDYLQAVLHKQPTTIFTGKTGALTSKKLSTGLVTPSNIWDAIPTGLRSPTTGSFPLRKQKSPSLHVAGNPGIQNGRSLSAIESLPAASWCMCSLPVSRRSAIMDSSITGWSPETWIWSSGSKAASGSASATQVSPRQNCSKPYGTLTWQSARNAAVQSCASWGGAMLLSHKPGFFSYRFFKASLWKACEACPEILLTLEIHPIFQLFIENVNFFGSPERYNPHKFSGWSSANWYNWKESHSEQFSFIQNCSFFSLWIWYFPEELYQKKPANADFFDSLGAVGK